MAILGLFLFCLALLYFVLAYSPSGMPNLAGTLSISGIVSDVLQFGGQRVSGLKAGYPKVQLD